MVRPGIRIEPAEHGAADRPMKDHHRRSVLNRLRTARGHLDAVLRMVEEDAYCPDVMKQLSAVQGQLERASRVVLRNHLETCVPAAMAAGRTDEIVEELMEAMRFDRITTGPTREPGAPARPRGMDLPRWLSGWEQTPRPRRDPSHLSSPPTSPSSPSPPLAGAGRTPAVPGGRVLAFQVGGMTCGSCAARVERTLGRHEGVASAGVNFATGRATVELDGASPATEGQLIGAVERVGYLAALHRPPPVGRTIEVSMSDDAYGPSVMTVAKGQRVRFVFHNEGRALHEALIGDAGLQAEHDRQMLSGHPHEPGLPVVDVPPGGKGVLLYTFTRSGQVLIGCRQPGHYSQGMRAVVTVL